jgi:SAM-dependent methyltransferase
MFEKNKTFTKEEFQNFWGDGYYDNFNYGVGIQKVCEVALYPFFDKSKIALEIGPGGGTFTEKMTGKFQKIYAIDVIKKPKKFENFNDVEFIECGNQNSSCVNISDELIDFVFSYNAFCHLSNELIHNYINDVYRVLKPNSDFVFMLANFEFSKQIITNPENFVLGDLLPFGHYYQNFKTIESILNDKWIVVSENLIPGHRDLIIHLKKK